MQPPGLAQIPEIPLPVSSTPNDFDGVHVQPVHPPQSLPHVEYTAIKGVKRWAAADRCLL